MPAHRRSTAVLLPLAALSMLVSTCGSDALRGPIDEASPRVSEGSQSDEPTSDIDLRTFQLASRAELLDHLDEVAWGRLLVLPGADPILLELWTGDGHWHAQTTYRVHGLRVEVSQVEGGGLPPGRLVRVRGEHGVRSAGNLYWIERAFIVAISPGDRSLAEQLVWIASQ